MKKAASLFICLFAVMSFALAGEPPSAPRPEDRGSNNTEPPVIVKTFNPQIVEPASPNDVQFVGPAFGGSPFDTSPAPVRGELYVKLIIRSSGSSFYIDCSTLPADAQSVEMVNRTTGERTGAYPARSGGMTIPVLSPFGQWEIVTVTATGAYYTASIRVD